MLKRLLRQLRVTLRGDGEFCFYNPRASALRRLFQNFTFYAVYPLKL